jgi:hypothetical protein
MSQIESSDIIPGYEHPVEIKTTNNRGGVYKTFDENTKEPYKSTSKRGIYSTFSTNVSAAEFEKELKKVRN